MPEVSRQAFIGAQDEQVTTKLAHIYLFVQLKLGLSGLLPAG
jgi:hypothetical protein